MIFAVNKQFLMSSRSSFGSFLSRPLEKIPGILAPQKAPSIAPKPISAVASALSLSLNQLIVTILKPLSMIGEAHENKLLNRNKTQN